MESHISGIAINFSGLKLLDSLGNSSLTGGRLFPVAVELGCFNISGAASCCNAPAGLACLRLLGYLIQGGCCLSQCGGHLCFWTWFQVMVSLISIKYQPRFAAAKCQCLMPMFWVTMVQVEADRANALLNLACFCTSGERPANRPHLARDNSSSGPPCPTGKASFLELGQALSLQWCAQPSFI